MERPNRSVYSLVKPTWQHNSVSTLKSRRHMLKSSVNHTSSWGDLTPCTAFQTSSPSCVCAFSPSAPWRDCVRSAWPPCSQHSPGWPKASAPWSAASRATTERWCCVNRCPGTAPSAYGSRVADAAWRARSARARRAECTRGAAVPGWAVNSARGKANRCRLCWRDEACAQKHRTKGHLRDTVSARIFTMLQFDHAHSTCECVVFWKSCQHRALGHIAIARSCAYQRGFTLVCITRLMCSQVGNAAAAALIPGFSL